MRDELNIDSDVIELTGNKSTTQVNRQLNDNLLVKKHFAFILIFLVYSITYTSFHFLSQNKIQIDSEFLISIAFYLLSIFIGASLSGKIQLKKQDKSEQILKTNYLSLFVSLFSLVIFFLTLEISTVKRIYILVAAFSGSVIELFYLITLSKHNQNNLSFVKQLKLPARYLLLDGIILTIFCYFEIVRNILPVEYNKTEFFLLMIIYFSWIISAAATHKFIPAAVSISRLNAFERQVKFYFGIIALVGVSMIFLQLEFSIASNFIKALAGYSFVSSVITMFLFASKIKNQSDESTVVFLKAYEMTDNSDRSNGRNGNGKYSYNTEREELSEEHKNGFEYLKEFGNVFSILDTIVDLKSFDYRRSLILNSDQPEKIKTQKLNSYQLVVNFNVLNDQIKLNDYLLEIRNVLVDKGVFIGALLPHHYRYRRYLKKYSFYTANFLYFFDFIWKRVMPKLPLTREIYSTFSKEKDRAISLAEGLGRLVYCGFKVLDLVVVDDVVYFAAVKKGNYTPVKKFFYSPIFKMKRVGKDGKPIYVYKLRTMYPYSEFIQDFVYNHNKLEDGGKFKDDFRVPAWGKLFRKLWIDELPMLINWFKRDLKFVGVRPISDQYLSLYSKEHQDKRKRFKPGLVPPYYADMPKTIEEIELSEKKYFDAYEKNPIKTDIKYFAKAVNNILLKSKRSA